MEVPASLRKDGRTFYVLTAHDGKAKVVAEGTGDTLAWSTGEFSTYLLAYKDAGSSGSGTGTGTTTKGTSTPKSGDSFWLAAVECAATSIVAGAAIAIALCRRRSGQ